MRKIFFFEEKKDRRQGTSSSISERAALVRAAPAHGKYLDFGARWSGLGWNPSLNFPESSRIFRGQVA